jgi:hypothetical protein
MSIAEFVFLTLKMLTLIGLGVYAIFAAVMVRQEQLMADVLEESFQPVLRTLVIIHFLASLALVALAFILL